MRNERPPTHTRPRVTVVTRPLWRLRLAGAIRHRLLRTLVVAGVLVAAHFATDIQQQNRQPHTPTAKEPRR
jgi:hypothetical protein